MALVAIAVTRKGRLWGRHSVRSIGALVRDHVGSGKDAALIVPVWPVPADPT